MAKSVHNKRKHFPRSPGKNSKSADFQLFLRITLESKLVQNKFVEVDHWPVLSPCFKNSKESAKVYNYLRYLYKKKKTTLILKTKTNYKDCKRIKHLKYYSKENL